MEALEHGEVIDYMKTEPNLTEMEDSSQNRTRFGDQGSG